MAPGRYLPLSDYGLIGDMRTSALVGAQGSVDWWCPDRFDAPSAFARILDGERGGSWSLRPDDVRERRWRYEPRTNILHTSYLTAEGRLDVRDFMPLTKEGRPVDDLSRIVRAVKCERGSVRAHMRWDPRPDYARGDPHHEVHGGGARTLHDRMQLVLAARIPLEPVDGAIEASFDLKAGEMEFLVAARSDGDVTPRPLDAVAGIGLLRDTRRYWERWAAEALYEGPYREDVVRSALALKALTHEPTGAVVAAPTMSLPECIGGVRNWDYRYAWIRDTAFAVTAFHQAGHLEDAGKLAHWVGDVIEHNRCDDVRIMYRVDGKLDLEEQELDHLEGHRQSSPVRLGNEAVDQFQLDVFGEAVDCLHISRMQGVHAEEARWDSIVELIDYVVEKWREPDSGIWEMRSRPRHFVISKVMAWVALDRGIRTIEALGLDGPVDRWRGARDEIRAEVLEKGYDKERRAFLQAYGEAPLDGSNLLISILGFLPATDERVQNTIERTLEELTDEGLVYRYRDADDGLEGGEGTFVICTFWLVEVLAQSGRIAEAKAMMERILARAGPLGLLAEQIDAPTGMHLGNYPQALSHIGLINAAAAIARAERMGEEASLHRTYTHTHRQASGPARGEKPTPS